MLTTLLQSLLAGFRTHQFLVLENLALRHQVQVCNRRSNTAAGAG